MKNRELLDVLENYVICLKDSMHYPTDLKQLKLKKAEKKFRTVLRQQENIAEIFSDLRNYDIQKNVEEVALGTNQSILR
jgi:hypothetical protein